MGEGGWKIKSDDQALVIIRKQQRPILTKDGPFFSYCCLFTVALERHADIEVEATRAGVLEIVVANVCQTDIIAHTEVEHLETHATAKAQSTMKRLKLAWSSLKLE